MIDADVSHRLFPKVPIVKSKINKNRHHLNHFTCLCRYLQLPHWEQIFLLSPFPFVRHQHSLQVISLQQSLDGFHFVLHPSRCLTLTFLQRSAPGAEEQTPALEFSSFLNQLQNSFQISFNFSSNFFFFLQKALQRCFKVHSSQRRKERLALISKAVFQTAPQSTGQGFLADDTDSSGDFMLVGVQTFYYLAKAPENLSHPLHLQPADALAN